MKDRIMAYLDHFAHARQNELADELQRELSMDAQTFRQHSQDVQSQLLHHYDHFGISTIDAFFQKVIRSFTREAGLVGDYRLEVDQDAVLEEVIDNLIDELGANKELTDWVVEFAKENLENERAWDVRQSLIEFAKEIFREEFKKIEDDLLEQTREPAFFKNLMNALKSKKFEFIHFIKSKSKEALKIIHDHNLTRSDFKYGGGPYNFFRKASGISSVKSFDEGEKGKRPETEFQNMKNWPDKATPSTALILDLTKSKLLPLMNDILQYWHAEYKTSLSAEVVLSNFYSFGLIADISRKLKEYKDENNIMLLADAPKFLNGIIRDSDTPFIYEKVGSFFRNYLIDEFQDTSGMQWQNFQPLIVDSLDQGYPSLVVGDVKQAIYRWRGGDLNLLQEKINKLIGEERVDPQQLDTNFRSAYQIVNFNNALFSSASLVLSEETGRPVASVPYADVRQQISKTDGGFVQIQFIEENTSLPAGGMEGLSPQSWKDIALDLLPVTLENLQENGASLKDIAILVRKNDEGQKIAAFLLQYKNSPKAKSTCGYDVVSNESLRIDGAASINLLLGAMRYLLNADDSIARAQLGYEFTRLHDPDRELSEVFAVSNQAIFENNLPGSFTKEKPALKKLSLIELTETLISIFNLGTIQGELIYLQAFQDLVLEFNNRERNDLEFFLEWWETNKHKKSIQISGEVNAIQILTIHKSKGLQFKFVIIPFCSWSLDHENWQAPNLWVKSPESLFNRAGYLPVKYSKNLEETFFSDYYTEEKTKTFLDNLNLLYVAFTRAEFGLIVNAPCIDIRGTQGTIAGLLYKSILTHNVLKNDWNAEDLIWKSGNWKCDGTPPNKSTSLHLTEYLSSSWRDKLVIRQAGAPYFQDIIDGQREKINHGIYMHTVLSRMHYADEIKKMLDQVVQEGFITEAEKMPLEAQLSDLLKNPKVSNWFSREWDVRTEVPILLPGGEENRIDRLLVKAGKAVIIDFKTGVRKSIDQKQVLQYIHILRQMNFVEVEGYLLYLGEGEIIEVKTGAKPKVVQKTKSNDQLDLGFDTLL